MINILQFMNGTDDRKDWSTVIDETVRIKPQFIKRTRDHVFLSDFHLWRKREEYYSDFSYWRNAPNSKPHIPYVFKAIFIGDVQKIGESIRCQVGRLTDHHFYRKRDLDGNVRLTKIPKNPSQKMETDGGQS